MNDHLNELTRKMLMGIGLVAACGFFTACKDDYTLDDEGNYPSWLGGSIYEALKNPESLKSSNEEVLTGTFTNYLRLVDDLGYAETLAKTGSKTVFPANDEAFSRFYAQNQWGVSRYEDLTDAMKRQLLYGSMLDNALLVEMLSNVSNGSTAVTQGQALKHLTSATVIDTITFAKGSSQMPAQNHYWDKFQDKGLYYVMDATRPMLVHFTEEQMTANNITTRGTNSDFEIITGTPYDAEEHSAYIFRNKIIHADVTCKNGYIHQMNDVLVPPGNLAEMLRTDSESHLWSRMLDRFSAPYYSSTTTASYNDYAQANGLPLIDSIYQKRYLSTRSQGGAGLIIDPNDAMVEHMLPYDPGWNEYTSGATNNGNADIAAMFVPTDEALQRYFLPGGEGEFLIDAYRVKDNTLENLEENIDSIPLSNIKELLSNLMQNSFVGTVPSKFGNVMDQASDPMGLSLDVINRNADGTFDVKIANNGVAYMLNTMFAPPRLIAVSAPMLLTSNMHVMNQAVSDGRGNISPLGLGQNYYAYLLAMSANYALFIPTDDAFDQYYIDPATLGSDQPRALHFYYAPTSPYVFCSAWDYDPDTHLVGDSIDLLNVNNFTTQLIDILNYHTIVLADGERLGDNGNHYYLTKHGGAIYYDGNSAVSGAQINGVAPASVVTQVYNQKNGTAYAVDHMIQAPQQSVLDVLQGNSQFSEFLTLCSDADMDSIMTFASDKLTEIVNTVTNRTRMEAYKPFVAKGGWTANVNYFNSYNYTVYAPDNDAMQQAYDRGLPRWSDIKVIYDQYNALLEEQREEGAISEEVQAARDKALAMVEEINSFIRYHFQDNSVFADQMVPQGTYPTASSDTLGIREKVNVSATAGVLTVNDKSGQSISVNGTTTGRVVNAMTRDYVINKVRNTITTSSFAVIHQVSTPLCSHSDTRRYDGLWTGANARKRLADYRQRYEGHLYQRYDAAIK